MYRALTACSIAVVFQVGCGIKTEIVASKYVRSQLIDAAQGGTLTVTAEDSKDLAGTQVIVPPGALSVDTVITVVLAAGSIAAPGVQTASPLVDLGPNGTSFNPPATVTLPFILPSSAQLRQLVVDALEGDGSGYEIGNASLAIDGGRLVAFGVTRFTRFEADIIPPTPPVDAGPAADAGDGGPAIDAGCMPGLAVCPSLDGRAGANSCVDVTSDVRNCGRCGNVCPPDAICFPQGLAGGTCICNTAEPGGGDFQLCAYACVHVDSDPLNCGKCNNPCDTGICNAGSCLCEPDAGIVRCAPHSCSNLNVDVKNCGACGNDCTLGGTLGLPQIVCVNGQCLCGGGQMDICFDEATFPTLVCISTASDPNNCGGCGLGDAGPLPDGALPASPYVCSGVTSSCENGSCVCPLGRLYCAAGTWVSDAGVGGVETCLVDLDDPLNCGGCGSSCSERYAADASCANARCACATPSGICVSTDDPVLPACDCSGFHDGGSPFISCNNGVSVTYMKDIYPLLSVPSVSGEPWGVLVGCAVSGCHDSSAAAGLAFTDPDASYQALVNAPSQICSGQTVAIPGDGNDSLLIKLLEDTFQCPNPIGGIATPMPIDDGGIYHPLSPCLIAQLREWIDQGMAY